MTISVVQRESNKWVKVFKNGPRKIFKICGGQIGPFLKTLAQK